MDNLNLTIIAILGGCFILVMLARKIIIVGMVALALFAVFAYSTDVIDTRCSSYESCRFIKQKINVIQRYF